MLFVGSFVCLSYRNQFDSCQIPHHTLKVAKMLFSSFFFKFLMTFVIAFVHRSAACVQYRYEWNYSNAKRRENCSFFQENEFSEIKYVIKLSFHIFLHNKQRRLPRLRLENCDDGVFSFKRFLKRKLDAKCI